jgi:two-component system nitrogen regulation sensor histidine kinase NtrY
VLGTWLESKIFDGLTSVLENRSFLSVLLFFSVLNLNAILAFVLIFLSFRNAVKLVVERQRAIYGSSLRMRLVTLFLFFSLIPTLILLYISTKFFNAHIERWLPPGVEQTSEISLKSETEYREKLSLILQSAQTFEVQKNTVDFVVDVRDIAAEPIFIRDKYIEFVPLLKDILNKENGNWGEQIQWLPLDNSRLLAAKRQGERVIGLIAPPTIYTRWQLLSLEVSQAQPGAELVKLSYYILLGAITVLLIFSALWLGVTIARELIGPLQALALATERVAAGQYHVDIDDVVSDDEIGQLARSFRSMVDDLRAANQRARASAQELEHKAALLSEKTDYYASVLQGVQASVFAVDGELRMEACNPATERLFMIQEAQAVGRIIGELFPREFCANWLRPLLLPLVDGCERRVEGEYAGKIFARDCQFIVTAHALIKPNQARAFLVIIEDVTELARAQRLAAWREVARKVAHEIKNPLTPILLGAQRLERRLLGKVQGEEHEVMRESLRVIVQSSNTIRQLVDEFVSVARMPGARLRSASLLETLRLVVAGFCENPDHISVELQFRSNPQEDFVTVNLMEESNRLMMRHDPEQLTRAFINLISNAMAASVGLPDARSIVLQVTGAGPGDSEILCSVVDWGHGVPEAVRERIFEPYFSTKRTGTGLGLVIVQQIVHEHAGRMSVAPNQPRGTVFSLSLPV